MSARQNRRIAAFIAGLAVFLMIFILTSQMTASSSLADQPTLTSSNTNASNALVYDEYTYDLSTQSRKYQFYSYQPSSSKSVPISVPGSLAQYVDSSYSGQSRSFYSVSLRTPQVPQAIQHFNVDQGQVISATIAPRVQQTLAVRAAYPSHDGKNVAFVLIHGGGGVEITYLGVYTPDEKLHILVAPSSIDTDGHLLNYTTNNYPGASPDFGVGYPVVWSPHDRYILFEMVAESTLHYISTDCLTDNQKPCTIHTLSLNDPATQYFDWSDVSWMPDGEHLLFTCYASILPTLEKDEPTPNKNDIQAELYTSASISDDLCTSALDGSDFRHLYVPHIPLEQPGGSGAQIFRTILTAISPDGRILAYAPTPQNGLNAPFDQWIYFYDLTTGRVTDRIYVGDQRYVEELIWLPLDVIHILDVLPTDTPTPTASITLTPALKLSLSPFCIPGRQLWGWSLVNPNPVSVLTSVTWTDAYTGKVMTEKDLAAPAQNGIPAVTRLFGLFTQSGSNVVQVYVSGVLQDQQQSPSIACTNAGLTPTPSDTAVPFH